MKKFLFFLTILLSSLIVKGNSSPNEKIFKYSVFAITECVFEDGEFYIGRTTNPSDNRTIVVTDEKIVVYIGKTNTKITFVIEDSKIEDGSLIYTTKHVPSKDKVLIIVNKFDSMFTFSFVNINQKEGYIYKAEYFE